MDLTQVPRCCRSRWGCADRTPATRPSCLPALRCARRRQGARDIVLPQATPPEFGGFGCRDSLYQAPVAQRTKSVAHGCRVKDVGIDPPHTGRSSACSSGVIIGNLRGHATDSPARWKEPRAFAAANHTSQRAPPGARSASDPSTCRRGVCATPWPGGKPDPSRARDTRAGA